jgi:hypothetical protein
LLKLRLELLGAAKIQYSTPGVEFQESVTCPSPLARLIPPSGGGGAEEEFPPPQATKMRALAKARMEERIECKNMNNFLCGTE